jgi:hypothetical protein
MKFLVSESQLSIPGEISNSIEDDEPISGKVRSMEILSNSNPIKKTKFIPSESESDSLEVLESNIHLIT